MPRLFVIRALPLFAAALLAACDGGGSGADPLASVAIAPDTAYVALNAAAPLQATARTRGGQAMTGVAFAWSSSDTSVAAVSAQGVVSGRRYGVATITATTEGVAGSATVWVTAGPGLTLITEPRDTIGGGPAELVAELRDDAGRPLAGERLRFEAVLLPSIGYAAQFENPGSEGVVPLRSVLTDAQGRATVRVRMGDVAGPAPLLVRHEVRGLADTVRTTVLPGAAVGVRLEPADTAVFRGRTVGLRATALDRRGNVTAGTASFTVADGPLGVDAAGVVSAPVYGTSSIIARIGERADTARVVSVPTGAIAAASMYGLAVMNLDGSGFRYVNGGGVSPAWSPDGERLAFVGGGLMYTVRATVPGAAAAPLISTPTGGAHLWPQYSPNGEWVYYFTRVPNEPSAIWRVRADGTGVEQVTPGPLDGHPSLSPDGTRMVYFFDGGRTVIRIRDLATGQLSPDLAVGHAPTWSPTGEWIAFNEIDEHFRISGLMVMRPDGSGLRRVSPPGARFGFSPRWSPDGEWIIADGGFQVRLIQVETGLMLQLPFPVEAGNGAAWKPGALLP